MNVVINSGRGNDRSLGLTPLNPALEVCLVEAGVAVPIL